MCLQDWFIREHSKMGFTDLPVVGPITQVLVPANGNRIFISAFLLTGTYGTTFIGPGNLPTVTSLGTALPSVSIQYQNFSFLAPAESQWWIQAVEPTTVVRIMERIMDKPLEALLAEYNQKYGR